MLKVLSILQFSKLFLHTVVYAMPQVSEDRCLQCSQAGVCISFGGVKLQNGMEPLEWNRMESGSKL